MPKLRPYARKNRQDKSDLIPIYIVYSDSGKEAMFPTGRKVHPKYWEPKATERWISKDYGEGREEFNRVIKKMLSDYQQKIDKFFLEHGKDPTVEQFKVLCEGESKKSFYALFEAYMKFQSGKRGVKSVTSGTSANYQKTLNHIKAYEKHTNSPFDFHSIGIGFNDSFINYLTREKHQSINTIGSNIKIIKSFLHWAELYHEVKINPVVMNQLKILQERVPMVFLELYEIDLILALSFSDKLLERVRDAFALQCAVGCRFSDLIKVVKENLRFEGGVYMLKIKTIKNKKHIDVPLTGRAVKIIEKYKGIDAKDWVPSMVDCNKHIKTVCKMANILDSVQIVKGGGAFRKEKTVKKYELISTHSAVRSFINIMRLQGIDLNTICDIVGKSRRTIETYIHTNYNEISTAMNRVWEMPRNYSSPEPNGNTGTEREYEKA